MQKIKHRAFFSEKVHFHTIFDLSKEITDQIHFNYRLTYVRDSALAHILYERTIQFINLVTLVS